MQDARILRHLYVFEGLTGLQLTQFNKILETRPMRSGERIVQEGDEADRMYVIVSGRVRVVREGVGGTQLLAELGAGEHFGEISLIDRRPRSASVEAVADGELCVLGRDDVRRILDAFPEIKLKVYENFLESLCERLRAANDHLLIATGAGAS